MANLLSRDVEDTIWSVLTSFGFNEEDEKSQNLRCFNLDKKNANILNGSTLLAKAETVAAVIETVFAIGETEFKVTVSNKEIFDMLVLFGFENILRLEENINDGFSVVCDHTEIAFGKFYDDKSTARIDISSLLHTSKNIEEEKSVSKSLAYAEIDAEGLCYDVCYNLRVNGCIVEYYTGDRSIKKACEYAEKEGHSCILRCYKDGKLEIKDLVKNEITETTVQEFLGYYEDDCDDEECDCGEHHHHGEECDCGHHHH